MKKMMRHCVVAVATATLVSLATPLVASAHTAKLAVYLYDCSTRTQRPTSLTLSCADANTYLTKIHWDGWSGTTAHATGTLHWNTCTPTCVAGSEKTKTVVFMAMDRRDVKGTWLYTELKARKSSWGTGSAYYPLPTSAL